MLVTGSKHISRVKLRCDIFLRNKNRNIYNLSAGTQLVCALSTKSCLDVCRGREPFKPQEGSVPFLVYYPSRYRGMCVGTLVSRTAVLTAAVCVTNPVSAVHDTRPITIVTGTTYRHPRRGIRVQVTKLLIPRLTNVTGNRGYLMQKSPALMMLKRRVPDLMVEVPLRALPVDWTGEEVLTLQEECFTAGWHFFYKGDRIYPVHKFLLQRTVRVQFLNIVKKNLWCEPLTIKFQKALTSIGFFGYFDKGGSICVKDPDRGAQPCHGMYGGPLICRAKLIGILMAPDAQWTNCTGFSNLVHVLSGRFIKNYMTCISKLFEPDEQPDWATMRKRLYHDEAEGHYDYVPAIYDRLTAPSDEDTTEAEDVL